MIELDNNPAATIVAGVSETLALATTWLSWSGRPIISEDGDRIYTPHKAIRRYVDHLIDHLAEVECLLGGAVSEPDRWHASLITFDSDWARFTEVDLDEARQRLVRLGRLYELRYVAAGEAEWDRSRDPSWTLRQIAEHVGDAWYARQVGKLAKANGDAMSAPY